MHLQKFKRFGEVHKDLEDHPRSGRPLAAQNQGITGGVCEIYYRRSNGP